jgi:integrase
MLGFEKDEAATILRAAAQAANPVHRWVPLLCAQSGARVSEVCQLRKEDVRSEDGIHYMHFRSEAGGLKNPSSERKVPLHPYVIKAGFTEFVAHRMQGPLFYDPKRRHPDAKKPQPKIAAKNVARWVHTLGIKVGRRFRKDPNHAWRHLFRTLARDASIEESVVNAIQGHAAATIGQSYGETLLRTAQRAIERIPIPGVGTR